MKRLIHIIACGCFNLWGAWLMITFLQWLGVVEEFNFGNVLHLFLAVLFLFDKIDWYKLDRDELERRMR